MSINSTKKGVDIRSFSDGPWNDAFGRFKTASPQTLFDAQFTYDLQPLVYEAVTPANTSILHDATNRRAAITMTNAAAGAKVYLQTYEYFRYQPGKSHEINITFNFGLPVSDCRNFAQYGDQVINFSFTQDGDGTLKFNIVSGTGVGTQSVSQANWNIDKLDGNGKSKVDLKPEYDQILYIDLQALYVGRVRFGFVIDGKLIIAHEFYNANKYEFPYVDSANLPISVGMINTGAGTVSNQMFMNCAMVASSGGIDEAVGYEFSTPDVSVTAANGARTHLVSLRPKTTFNGITNRSKLASLELDLLVTGNSPVYWELLLNQTFGAGAGQPTWADINTNYSAFEYGVTGSLAASSVLVIDSGYVAASASTKGTTNMKLTDRYPITLNAAGSTRLMGTLSLMVTGIGGSSACRGVLKHKEIR